MVRRRVRRGTLGDFTTTLLTDLNAPISWVEAGLYNSFYGPVSPSQAQAQNSLQYQACLKAAGGDAALAQACYQQSVADINAVNADAIQGTPEGYVSDLTGSGVNTNTPGPTTSTVMEVVVVVAVLGVGLFLLKR